MLEGRRGSPRWIRRYDTAGQGQCRSGAAGHQQQTVDFSVGARDFLRADGAVWRLLRNDIRARAQRILKHTLRYVVGESIASSIYGIPRATQDVDVIADLQERHIPGCVAALREDFHLDEPAVRDAVRRRSTFDVIHLHTMFKVDVFVAKNDAATVLELARAGDLLARALRDAGLAPE